MDSRTQGVVIKTVIFNFLTLIMAFVALYLIMRSSPDLPLFVPPGSTKPTLDNSMKSSKFVSGQEVLEIANSYSRGIRLSRLFELISERFGPHARFCVGCHIGVDFDCLMVYLESHGILSISDGVVFTSFPLARAM